MDASTLRELKQFVADCKSNPSILHNPDLSFFKSYLQSLGARIPQEPKMEKVDDYKSNNGDHFDAKKPFSGEDEYDIVESDIELDNTDLVEPDNDPPQKMGNPSDGLTEDKMEAAQAEKSKAMDAIMDGRMNEAIDHLTEAIMLNPSSAILYATRATVFIKLKKPNAAMRDADAALKINPDSAKGYKARGMARAMLGLWEESVRDLHVASNLDYDEEISSVLKKVEPNVHKIEEHRRKYERLHKQKEMKKVEHDRKKVERDRKKVAEAQIEEALSALKDGQVSGIHSGGELDKKLSAASKTSRLAILYFTATWCGPCRFISPLFTSLAEKYPKVVFLKVDIDEAADVAARWNISSVPSFFFIKNGEEVDKLVGADKGTLERKIAQHAGNC